MERDIDQDFVDFMGAYFGYGYGSGEEYWFPAIKKFFELLEEERNYDHEKLTKELGGLGAWSLINTFCEADILDYGTSPRHGWLSEKGERLRDYLADKSVDDLIGIYNNGEVRCGKDYCNCDEGGHHSENKRCGYNKFFNSIL